MLADIVPMSQINDLFIYIVLEHDNTVVVDESARFGVDRISTYRPPDLTAVCRRVAVFVAYQPPACRRELRASMWDN
jgi:hypothetical protein